MRVGLKTITDYVFSSDIEFINKENETKSCGLRLIYRLKLTYIKVLILLTIIFKDSRG